MGFGSISSRVHHSISRPSPRHSWGGKSPWGGNGAFVGGNPSTWSPVPTPNPFIEPSNPFTALKKKIESVIPSSDPHHVPSKSPEIGGDKFDFTPLLILAGIGGAVYFFRK
jgi:hypothetical protein